MLKKQIKEKEDKNEKEHKEGVLKNVQLETSAKGGFNLNASGSLTMDGVNEKTVPEGSYGIKAVRGAASKTLTYLDKNVENPITGFGTVCFGENTEVSAVLTLKKVRVAAGKTLCLQNTFKADEYGSEKRQVLCLTEAKRSV